MSQPIACPDSPQYNAVHDTTEDQEEPMPRDANGDNHIETKDALYSGTHMPCFEFIGQARSSLLEKLKTMTGCEDTIVFPGPQPMSIDRSMFQAFREDTYWASQKTDGVRAVMMITTFQGHNVAVLFDRGLNRVFGVSINVVPRPLYQNTLFDGEIVLDNIQNTWTFLIFDTYITAGYPQFHKPFNDRMNVVWTSLQPYTYSEKDNLKLEVKAFYPLHECSKESLHDPRFRNDGYIFMPQSKEYVFGHHMTFFKLKQHHTVDLKVDGDTLLAYNTGTKRHVKAGILHRQERRYDKGTIVECTLHEFHAIPSKRIWKVQLVRRDKTKANSVFVLDKTLLNIKENLQFDDIRNIVVQ